MKLFSKIMIAYLWTRYVLLTRRIPKSIQLTSYWGVCLIDGEYYVYEDRLTTSKFDKKDYEEISFKLFVNKINRKLI